MWPVQVRQPVGAHQPGVILSRRRGPWRLGSALASAQWHDHEGSAVSVNWPKPDRSKWVVPIVVAFIAAIGTVIAALAPSLFGGDDDAAPSNVDTPPTASVSVPGTGRPTPGTQSSPPSMSTDVIAYSGDDGVSESDPAVDLDSSTDGTGGDNVGDLVHTNPALTTGNGSLIVLLDRAQIPTLGVCRSALNERGVDMITASRIETGISLCIRTTAGRTGALTRTNVSKLGDPQQIIVFYFSYVIWDAATK